MKKLITITLLLICAIPSFSEVIWLKTTHRRTCNSEIYQPYKTDIKIDYENKEIWILAPSRDHYVKFYILSKLETDDGNTRISEFTCKNLDSINKVTIYTYVPTEKIVGVNVKISESCVVQYLIVD